MRFFTPKRMVQKDILEFVILNGVKNLKFNLKEVLK